MTITDPNELPPHMRTKLAIERAVKVLTPIDEAGKAEVRFRLTRQLDDFEWFFTERHQGNRMRFIDQLTVATLCEPARLAAAVQEINSELERLVAAGVKARASADQTKREVSEALEDLDL